MATDVGAAPAPTAPSPSNLPLLLSIVAGGGTFVGGVVLLALLPTPPSSSTFPPKSSYLFGRLQAASAGVMLILSINLLAESLPKTGLLDGALWLVAGAVVMYVIERLIPDGGGDAGGSGHGHGHGNEDMLPLHAMDASGAAAGEMLEDAAGKAKGDDGTRQSGGATGGGSCFWVIQNLFGDSRNGPVSSVLARAGFVTYLGLALHNLPEGISVAVSTASSLRLGVSLCVAIMLHNVLEGMVVALPLWFATRSRTRVLWLTLLNGLMEPAGVIVAWIFGASYFLEAPGRVERILCAVAGVMGSISFAELIPSASLWIARGAATTVAGASPTAPVEVSRKWINARVAAWTILGMVAGWTIMALADVILVFFVGKAEP